MDITGVDRYLPREDQIASMSVYFNSINGQFGYPEGNDTSDMSAFLRENKMEDFQDIYALAQKGVEYYEQEGPYDQQESVGGRGSSGSGNLLHCLSPEIRAGCLPDV